jgi:hypothetical protein
MFVHHRLPRYQSRYLYGWFVYQHNEDRLIKAVHYEVYSCQQRHNGHEHLIHHCHYHDHCYRAGHHLKVREYPRDRNLFVIKSVKMSKNMQGLFTLRSGGVEICNKISKRGAFYNILVISQYLL